MRSGLLTIRVEYDEAQTNLEDITDAVDGLLTTALSTEGILDEVGNPALSSVDGAPGIWVSLIHHRHGEDTGAALTEERCIAQVAAYCRQFWREAMAWNAELSETPPVDDQECIDLYFEAVEEEWCDTAFHPVTSL